MFGRGMRAGIDRREQKKQSAQHEADSMRKVRYGGVAMTSHHTLLSSSPVHVHITRAIATAILLKLARAGAASRNGSICTQFGRNVVSGTQLGDRSPCAHTAFSPLLHAAQLFWRLGGIVCT
jgi:hypothetical protein